MRALILAIVLTAVAIAQPIPTPGGGIPCSGSNCTVPAGKNLAAGNVVIQGYSGLPSDVLFIGTAAGPSGNATTTGTGNLGIGYQTGKSLTVPASGANPQADTFIGSQAGKSVTTAREMTCIGYFACASVTGNGAGVEDGLGTIIGSQAGAAVTTGEDITAIGQKAGGQMTTGSESVFVGSHAGLSFVGNSNNDTIIGTAAAGNGNSTITGTNDVYVGYDIAPNSGTQTFNVAVGSQALAAATSITGDTMVGDTTGNAITTGGHDTCVGDFACSSLTTGSHNSFFGDSTNTNSGASTFRTVVGASAVGNTDYTVTLGGHVGSNQQSTAVGITGTGCTLTYGNDNDGKITLSAGATACTVTFGHAYSQPVAQLTASSTSILPIASTLTTAALTITVAAASGVVYYHLSDVN